MMGELKKMQEDLRKQAKPDVRALQDDLDRTQRENAELRAALDEAERSAPTSDASAAQLDDLREEQRFLLQAR